MTGGVRSGALSLLRGGGSLDVRKGPEPTPRAVALPNLTRGAKTATNGARAFWRPKPLPAPRQSDPRPLAALRGFFRIADSWRLDRRQRATLLAASERSIDHWQVDAAVADLTRDQVERLSHVIGIYGGLHAILWESPLADNWVRRPNADFGNAAPLDRMLAGNLGDLADVHRYIDAWRIN